MPLAGAVPSVAGWRLTGLPPRAGPGSAAAAAGQLRPAPRPRSAGLRDHAAAVPAGAAGRRGRRTRAGRHRLARRRDRRSAARPTEPSGCRCRPTSARRSPAYLRRGRPATAQGRSVFVRVQAPHRALTTGGVSMVVHRRGAAGRAGRDARAPAAAHRRHRDAARRHPADRGRVRCCGTARALTTAIYAKVDRDALPGAGPALAADHGR